MALCNEAVTSVGMFEQWRASAHVGEMIQLTAKVRLAQLIGHPEKLDASTPLTEAHAVFTRTGHGFLGVVREGVFVGIASGRMIAEMLSLKFGRALFDRSPLGSYLLQDPLVVFEHTPLTEVLRMVSARNELVFYDDIALVSPDNGYIGLIPVHRLMQLQTSLLLENLEQVEVQRCELAHRNERMETDLRMAREVQLALLPSGPLSFEHGGRRLSVEHWYAAAELMGGDFYSVFEASPGLVACCIFDVMGHGVKSALITAIVQSLVKECQAQAGDPGLVLSQINQGLQSVLRSVNEMIFVTAGICVVDLARQELRYAQAGHHAPLLFSAQSGEVCELVSGEPATGPALGLLGDHSYRHCVQSLRSGDALMIYTDGVVEVAGPEGEEFGVARLASSWAEALRSKAGASGAAVLDIARKFGAAPGFVDDTCVLVLRTSV